MTDEQLYELLEEAHAACGRSADRLVAFLGPRLPDDPAVRRVVSEKIFAFTGQRVLLLTAAETEGLVTPSSHTADTRPSEPSASGCSWCGRADVLLGGVVVAWAAARHLEICQDCAQRPLEALEASLCAVCGKPLAIGQWPCITIIRPHGKSVQTDPFITYFDVGLGKEITSLGDRWNAMKAEPGDAHTDGRGRLEYRDKASRGDLSARRDRIEERRRDDRRRERGR